MAFSALKHRNFRLYLSGQFVSLIGTWMQQAAVSWLVFRLTQSNFWLGAVSFCSQIPMLLLALPAGVLVDRASRHKLLIATQTLSLIQATALWALAFTGKIHIWELIALGTALGIVNSLDMPTRQTFVIEMVGDRSDLPNAIALNSSVMNGTRLIGPSIAGAVIAARGESLCFFLNALSYVAVLIALFAMRIKPRVAPTHTVSMGESIRTGYHSAFGSRPIATLLISLGLLSFLGLPYMALLPAISSDLRHGDAHLFGLITSTIGLGALVCALYLTTRRTVIRLGHRTGLAYLLFGVSLVALSRAHNLWIAMPLFFVAGMTMMLPMASSNILIQTLVSDEHRGRVMSFFTLSIMGVSPFGNLFMGSLAQHFGLARTLLGCGIGCVAVALWFISRLGVLSADVRPIYQNLGIVPDDSRIAQALF